jgi:hypothetical protein
LGAVAGAVFGATRGLPVLLSAHTLPRYLEEYEIAQTRGLMAGYRLADRYLLPALRVVGLVAAAATISYAVS